MSAIFDSDEAVNKNILQDLRLHNAHAICAPCGCSQQNVYSCKPQTNHPVQIYSCCGPRTLAWNDMLPQTELLPDVEPDEDTSHTSDLSNVPSLCKRGAESQEALVFRDVDIESQ